MKKKIPPRKQATVLQKRYGSPLRSMRWKQATWDQLYAIASQHGDRVKVNRVAEVAVGWGLAFLRSLDPSLRARMLGAGGKPLTYMEREKFRAELTDKLGSIAGTLRLDDRLAFALPRLAKQLIREESSRVKLSMSEVARRKLLQTEGGLQNAER